MWYFSVLFMYLPFFAVWIISIIYCMFPYVWPVFSICCAYVDVSLLYLRAHMCSLYLVWNDRPSMHLSLYTPLLSYLFLYCFGCKCFCTVLVVLNAIFVLMSVNVFVICFVSCLKYVNVIHLQVFSLLCHKFFSFFSFSSFCFMTLFNLY
jgi:hypothetical protein